MTEIVAAVGMLREWLESNGRSQSWLALRMCVEQSTVSRWFRGHMRPDADVRDAIETLAGIATVEWLTTSERAKKADRDLEVAIAVSQRAA
jgi:transcriptional regulator with XRE-family HTH domain